MSDYSANQEATSLATINTCHHRRSTENCSTGPITMRFNFAIAALLATLKVGESFAPSQNAGRWGNQVASPIFSTVEADTEASAVEAPEVPEANGVSVPSGAVSASDIKEKLQAQLEKLRQKDSKSPKLSKEVSSSSWRKSVF